MVILSVVCGPGDQTRGILIKCSTTGLHDLVRGKDYVLDVFVILEMTLCCISARTLYCILFVFT